MGQLKEQWSRLTDADTEEIEGQWDRPIGDIQECYGMAKEKAEQELPKWR